MATKKNTAADEVEVVDNTAKKVEDNDTDVVQTVTEKPRIIRVIRVENKDLEVTLQRVGYENVAQILVEPSLGFALFNVIYWENED